MSDDNTKALAAKFAQDLIDTADGRFPADRYLESFTQEFLVELLPLVAEAREEGRREGIEAAIDVTNNCIESAGRNVRISIGRGDAIRADFEAHCAVGMQRALVAIQSLLPSTTEDAQEPTP